MGVLHGVLKLIYPADSMVERNIGTGFGASFS